MKTRKTFIPVVAVALAALLVAPGCDKKNDDKPAKPGVANTGSNSGSGSQNSGSNNSQNSGNSGQTDPQKPGQTDPQKPGQTDPQKPGQTDPQKPGLTPEQIQEIVTKVDGKIRGVGGLADVLQRQIAGPKRDAAVVEQKLAEAQVLKKELEKLPDGAERKAELQAKVDTLIEAAEAMQGLMKAELEAEAKPVKDQADINQKVAVKKVAYESAEPGETSASDYIAALKEEEYRGVEKEVVQKLTQLAGKLKNAPAIHQGVDAPGVLKHEAAIKEILTLKQEVEELMNSVTKGDFSLSRKQLDKQQQYVESMQTALERARYNKEAMEIQEKADKLREKVRSFDARVKNLIP